MTIKYLDLSKPGNKPQIESTKFVVFKENDQKQQLSDKPEVIVLHWTAGNYTQLWDDYNFCIPFETKTKEAFVVKMLKWSEKPKHLWGRNGGSIGISFCAMVDSKHSVTKEQIDAAAKLIAEICAWKRIDPVGHVMLPHKRKSGSSLVNTGKSIEMPTITDHAAFAKKDGYFPDRWDIGDVMPVVRTRAIEEFKQLKDHTDTFNFKELLS